MVHWSVWLKRRASAKPYQSIVIHFPHLCRGERFGDFFFGFFYKSRYFWIRCFNREIPHFARGLCGWQRALSVFPNSIFVFNLVSGGWEKTVPNQWGDDGDSSPSIKQIPGYLKTSTAFYFTRLCMTAFIRYLFLHFSIRISIPLQKRGEKRKKAPFRPR